MEAVTVDAEDLFIAIARKAYNNGHLEGQTAINRGTIILKRSLLGLCGLETTKTAEELTDVVRRLSGVEPQQASQMVPKLSDKEWEYGGIMGLYGLKFTQTIQKGQAAYKIERIKYVFDDGD